MTRELAVMRVLTGLALWGMAEIAAFVVVGGWIGLLGVLAVVLGSGVLGVAVLRWQGMQVVRQLQMGAVRLGPGMLVGVGALLLILPGILGDVVGLVLLVPVVRRGLLGRFQPVVAEDDVLEGVAVEVEAPRLGSGWTKP